MYEERSFIAADCDGVVWNKGLVYVEEPYSNILYAKDGGIYDFHGKSVMPIGGASAWKGELEGGHLFQAWIRILWTSRWRNGYSKYMTTWSLKPGMRDIIM